MKKILLFVFLFSYLNSFSQVTIKLIKLSDEDFKTITIVAFYDTSITFPKKNFTEKSIFLETEKLKQLKITHINFEDLIITKDFLKKDTSICLISKKNKFENITIRSKSDVLIPKKNKETINYIINNNITYYFNIKLEDSVVFNINSISLKIINEKEFFKDTTNHLYINFFQNELGIFNNSPILKSNLTQKKLSFKKGWMTINFDSDEYQKLNNKNDFYISFSANYGQFIRGTKYSNGNGLMIQCGIEKTNQHYFVKTDEIIQYKSFKSNEAFGGYPNLFHKINYTSK